MNKIKGYRNMIGYSQKKMSSELGISEGTYRQKENGYKIFNLSEVERFMNILYDHNIEASVNDVFFTTKPTK